MRAPVLALALVVAVPATSAAALDARLYAPTHHPRADRPWRIRITARSSVSGRPVRADVRYVYLYQGQVVGRRSHYYFRGTFRDTIIWPRRSIGIALTFRAVVTSRVGRRNLDYAVRVRR
ncbi:MAG: hypothetical protein ACXVFN_02010 [Solirubrobacteraceae bacterium]